MTVGILAVQGAFAEHKQKCVQLGADCIELRNHSDMHAHYDALILPGGESTVQGKLLNDLGMFDTLKARIESGIPVFATCAGMILLADKIENDDKTYLRSMPITVRRNAYGRQLGSFYTESDFKGLGTVPMTFIRAPYIGSVSDEVEVLAVVDNHIVAARYKNQLAVSFHPELNDDLRIHKMFLEFGK
ncbi:MAG: pyridoxal 5'-phosphate synthase glutaminase subunit PdxT [Spirochaetales bacterium]|nr:pyridoxal 5'-phosphate synthase glutaminase subunit PdxT [Spirochaetales bacterium]